MIVAYSKGWIGTYITSKWDGFNKMTISVWMVPGTFDHNGESIL